MTAKLTASADGSKVLIGTAAEDALEIDATGKVVKVLAPYSLQGVPSGAVMDFAMNAAPAGWLACNGALVSRATYAALFIAIGTTWGAGDGSTTFQLPDMRGYFRRGVGTNADGTAAGAFAAKQAQAFLAHNHTINDPTHNHTTAVRVGNTPGAGGAGLLVGSADAVENPTNRIIPNSASTGISINNAGGAETRPANIAVLTCIKT